MSRSPDDRELDLLLARDKAVGPAVDAMWEKVSATLPAPRRSRSWRLPVMVAAPALAAAAAVLIFVGRPPSGLQPKGPVVAALVDVACSGGSRGACPSGSTLVFALGGTDRPTYLTAWAQAEGSDERIWYFGGSGEALRLEAREAVTPLSRAIALGPEHHPGTYLIHWTLADAPPVSQAAPLAQGKVSLTIVPR
jgi:hypothetical protein